MLTNEQLQAIEARYWAARRNADEYWIEHIPALLAEVRRLRTELRRVAAFMAIHGIEGYEFEEADDAE